MLLAFLIKRMKAYLAIRSKHCNTDGRSVWTARETMLKNKANWVTFQPILVLRQLCEHFLRQINFSETATFIVHHLKNELTIKRLHDNKTKHIMLFSLRVIMYLIVYV